jgi:exoribonuclease-2
MTRAKSQQRAYLADLAVEAMRARGFEPEFPPGVLAAVRAMPEPAPEVGQQVRDARKVPWCSIDNDDSRDIDQLTAAEAVEGERIRILVAIADVSERVASGSGLDRHARTNTTSVYTPPRVFAMLPERLSTDLTSLNAGVDRTAVVVEAEITTTGDIESTAVYRAVVHNRAQLAYPSVGAWLEGTGPLPPAAGQVPGLGENLRLQDRAAQAIEGYRREQGALEFAPLEVKAVFKDEQVHELRHETPNRARDLIENFMIAANGVIARFLADRDFPVLRRVVRSPERWDRIRDLAEDLGTRLPGEADARALQVFLKERRTTDPVRYPDLSLAVIKLLGRGEYVASFPGDEGAGHFGLAVSDYTHSTAPNRRYPDLITQRMVRAALAGQPCPFESAELRLLARHCTEKQDDAQRVERQLIKSAAALLLDGRWGESFDGIVTGAGDRGTWVRVFDPPVEGRVERGGAELDVGDRVRVKLISTNPEKGFIDFDCVGHTPIGRRRRRGGSHR